MSKRGKPESRAPFRLVSLHTIELFLNAFLHAKGMKAAEIRGLQHDFSKRTDAAITRGLHLKKGTISHLHTLAETREYLVTRYGPEMTVKMSEINRPAATMQEVERKVSSITSTPKSEIAASRV